MRFQYGIFFFLLVSITTSLAAQRSRFANVLDLQTTVSKTDSIEATVFSDKGAWHAYALPARSQDYGSFIGPLLMDMKGAWLANTFSQLQLYEEGQLIPLQKAKVTLTYYPGLLEQQLETRKLKILLRLLFVSGREALLQTKIVNLSEHKRKLSIVYTGTALLPSVKMKAPGRQLEVSFSGNEHHFFIRYLTTTPLKIEVSGNSYAATMRSVALSKDESFELSQLQSFYLQPGEIVNPKDYQFATELTRNERRWNGYLQKYFSKAPPLTKEKNRLAVKSMITLLTNWRSKGKDILHDGVFPSVNYQGFYGVWSWDSWKQAAALACFDPELAKENIRSMFDYQDDQGMVADCIYADKKENNWRDTKPPLAAWAVWTVYQQSKDIAFIRQLYPKLVQYHLWWYRNRDHDQNGLCEYGSTDGTRIAAAWESGMDNAVRFDSAVMVKNNDGAWSLNQESVDLNAYLYAEKVFLSKLAAALGKNKASLKWKKQSVGLAAAVRQYFFDKSGGYYYDKTLGEQRQLKVEGPEGWIPLWAGIATKKQALGVKNIMADTAKFYTKVPLPTLTADHWKFDPLDGYWRGPVWLDQFYFGIVGLKNYSYHALTDKLLDKLFTNAEGLLTTAPVCENYHPLTGQALNARNFSWSAAHILLLLKLK